jgi:hypothetical protein
MRIDHIIIHFRVGGRHMTSQEYSTLRRYAMKLVKDPDDRDELLLLAWEESKRLGPRSSIGLLVNYMKLIGKERKHSFLGAMMSGKSARDAMNRGVVSFARPIAEGLTLDDQIGTSGSDPFGLLLVKEFESSLTVAEEDVAGEIVAGYTERESLDRLALEQKDYRRAKYHVRRKAIMHLA